MPLIRQVTAKTRQVTGETRQLWVGALGISVRALYLYGSIK